MVVAALLVVVWPDHDQQRCYHHVPTVKPEVATGVVVARDDRREDARNMLSRTLTSSNKVEKLLNLVG